MKPPDVSHRYWFIDMKIAIGLAGDHSVRILLLTLNTSLKDLGWSPVE
jgi:hypothetical protein